MDLWVQNILIEWSLVDYLDTFAEQEINQEAFECLDDDTIKILFPKAGPRAIFKKKLTALKERDIKLEISENKKLSDHTNDSSEMIVVDFDPSESIETDILNAEVQAEVIDPFHKIDNADISLVLCNPITNLLECMKQSILGAAVSSYYQKNRMLNDYYRNLLCDTVLQVEIRSNTELQISPERFIDLSELIVEVYCTEDIQTYYVPYQFDKVSRNKVLAKGKLYQRYNRLRGILLESGVVVSSRGVKRKIIDKSLLHLGFYDDLECQAATDEINVQLEFVHDNIDPWDTVKKYWENTSIIRIKRLVEDKTTTSTAYINSFPILQHPEKALILINIDFKTQYPEKSDQLKNEIKSFKSEIYKFCKSKKKHDKEVKVLLSQLESAKANKAEEYEDVIIFRLLPLLLPCPPPIYKLKQEPHRPKKVEVQEEFLHYAKDEEELKSFLKKRKENFTLYGISEQPLSVIVGETLESIQSYYLVINNIKYEAKSVTEVIDLNFKSCYSFQSQFSKIAINSWLVLQERIYKIRGGTDQIRPHIIAFIASLKTNL